jgi:hypothetical protein
MLPTNDQQPGQGDKYNNAETALPEDKHKVACSTGFVTPGISMGLRRRSRYGLHCKEGKVMAMIWLSGSWNKGETRGYL